jgi:hypothetical protein
LEPHCSPRSTSLTGNDECRSPNDERMPKSETRNRLVIRPSSFFGHSSFVIRP